MTNQRGIALIQILIITAILSVVAIYISKSARQQVKMAQWSMDRSQAIIAAHSARAIIQFELLSRQWLEPHQSQFIEQPWNFYSKPFIVINGVSIAMQDQAGLLNLSFPEPDAVLNRLAYEGLESSAVSRAFAVLLDWQDSDRISKNNGDESNRFSRNGVMSYPSEWLLHKTITAKQYKNIAKDFTLYGSSHINLITSPRSVIASLTSEATANEVIKLREQGELTSSHITRLSGLSPNINFFSTTSNNVSLLIVARYGESIFRQRMVVKISPYAQGTKNPYDLLQVSND